MNVVFLFNADHPSLGGRYGISVINRILGTNVLQKVERNMRVSVGDILLDGDAHKIAEKLGCHPLKVYGLLYSPVEFNRLIVDRLVATFGKANVCCWLLQNITSSAAELVHKGLLPGVEYLGAMDADFSNPFHLDYFRNSLIEVYRLKGTACSIFYSMGENEDPDISVRESFEKNGYGVVYEDMGARRTIFDDFYSLEHFARIKEFAVVMSAIDGLDADRVSDIILTLEEIHPKLFDALAASARAFKQAKTDEDFAQAAFSGRRFLERLADYLYPARTELLNGRKVGKAEYKNRLWAYIENAIPADSVDGNKVLKKHGKELDRLVELFNSGLHHNPTREKVMATLRDLVVWLAGVVSIDFTQVRKPYLAYNENIRNLLLEAKRVRDQQKLGSEDAN